MNPTFSRRTGLRALAAAVVAGTVTVQAPEALARTAAGQPWLVERFLPPVSDGAAAP